MARKLGLIALSAFMLGAGPAAAKGYTVRLGTSCETATFTPVRTDPNLWQYTGTGVDLCASFYGLGFKTKTKLEGHEGTWLTFSIHSNDGDFAGNVETMFFQYPIVDSGLYVMYGTSDDHSVHVIASGTYTLQQAP